MNLNQQLSKHFSLWECIRSEEADRRGIDNTPPETYIPKFEFVCNMLLEPPREFYGIPFHPNSVYRCAEVNALVGGSNTSQHMKAEAVDFEIPTISNYDLAVWCSNHILVFDQLILECYKIRQPSSGWVHISVKMNPEANRKEVLTFTGGQRIAGLVR